MTGGSPTGGAPMTQKGDVMRSEQDRVKHAVETLAQLAAAAEGLVFGFKGIAEQRPGELATSLHRGAEALGAAFQRAFQRADLAIKAEEAKARGEEPEVEVEPIDVDYLESTFREMEVSLETLQGRSAGLADLSSDDQEAMDNALTEVLRNVQGALTQLRGEEEAA